MDGILRCSRYAFGPTSYKYPLLFEYILLISSWYYSFKDIN
ncbi:MAG: hypothetical protein UV60_C0004G0042 [Parcubacteria group bacterium GW2011_GWA2_43_11]|nr:MAG: hypothetical protein UU89_C0017G0027 [Parcubacteria group bacterium GW2011_GWC2_42_11]KKS85965.1 MAG: hypothetical protein UV60_C0004G0042 [Parcubacteria group bacterium GW2011_GWA2_43_11]